MAIIVEQEKRRINWFGIAVAAAVVGILVIAIYFLFLSPAPLIERVTPSGGLATIKTVSHIQFDPNKVLAHPVYKILRVVSPPTDTESAPPPRPNPFLPFR